ncbi:MAG TPA: hypothetical protein VGO91_04275 [Pyrinomonadaceae bacterium]|nr:hypothetical protein [Pyrinomonadaceae bacterium]
MNIHKGARRDITCARAPFATEGVGCALLFPRGRAGRATRRVLFSVPGKWTGAFL